MKMFARMRVRSPGFAPNGIHITYYVYVATVGKQTEPVQDKQRYEFVKDLKKDLFAKLKIYDCKLRMSVSKVQNIAIIDDDLRVLLFIEK